LIEVIKYDESALENVYTGADVLARQRVDAVQEALFRYEPELSKVKGIGFCVTKKHARYMAQMFNDRGHKEPRFVIKASVRKPRHEKSP